MPEITYAKRAIGCILGGAMGDAMGYPIEFLRADEIFDGLGPQGLTIVPKRGLISDDTQMTLFTMEALISAEGGQYENVAAVAYGLHRWYRTQKDVLDDTVRPEDGLLAKLWLYARRAPGVTCLSALAKGRPLPPMRPLPRVLTQPGHVNPASKGCGTVMRSAPFGLICEAATAAHCSRLTHGHPEAAASAYALAYLIESIVGHEMSLSNAVLDTMLQLARLAPGSETLRMLSLAVSEAQNPDSWDVDATRLGAGWTGPEALGIAVYAALRTEALKLSPDKYVRCALRIAVNHSGDSDSTGSITGNIVGALHGEDALPQDVRRVEHYEEIRELAETFASVYQDAAAELD